jgi:hypothetical protein
MVGLLEKHGEMGHILNRPGESDSTNDEMVELHEENIREQSNCFCFV